MVQRKWSEAEDAELRRLHAQGLPANQIRKRMGWALSTVSDHAKSLGLSFDRTPMVAAIAASQLDRRKVRGEIIDALYRRAQDRIAAMDAASTEGFMTLVPVGGGEQRTQTLKHVPTSDERNLANAISSYLGRAEALEKIDMDGGLTEARGMVGQILNAIRVSVEGMPRMNETKKAA